MDAETAIDWRAIAHGHYLALKRRQCTCIWAWTEVGYGPVTTCDLHRQLAAHEAAVAREGM